MSYQEYDVIVIGSGPAGQKAAIEAAKAGKKTAIVEKDRTVGGACVHRGTIPSKTLRENALRVKEMRKNASFAHFEIAEETELVVLLDRLEKVLAAHDQYMRRQMMRSGVEHITGRAEFVDEKHLEITRVRQPGLLIKSESIVIASGSIPRTPANIPVDHEHILDSDSILSITYLPKSLTVLGGGVIASEYASIFQALGVEVTMIDKYPLPLGFLDQDLTSAFVKSFEKMGGRWIGNTTVEQVYWDGISKVVCEIGTGEQIESEKLLCAAGRIANIADLKIENAGLQLSDRQLVSVDENLQTSVPGIYAAGDVIGPPSLASSSMEQGRRATCNAIANHPNDSSHHSAGMSSLIPTGIYAIPELSAIGLNEKVAKEKHGDVIIGKTSFEEIARGQISGSTDGILKLVTDPHGRKLLGVMIVGEGATELIHIGQMALIQEADVDVFVENVFNFPTLAEAYREAALDVISQRERKAQNKNGDSRSQNQMSQAPSPEIVTT